MTAASSSCFGSTSRFLDVYKEPLTALSPLSGYTKAPLVSLQESVASLHQQLHQINSMASDAIERSTNPANDLTRDESAAIRLYTMDSSSNHSNLYSELNKTLRHEDRGKLKPWFRYLKLILTALLKLPSTHCTVWRAVRVDLRTKYANIKTIPWWGFSSCTSSIHALKEHLGTSGKYTIFSIECVTGKKIKNHSNFENEEEILLLPGTYFEVISQLSITEDICIIHLREIPRCNLQSQPFWNIHGGKNLTKDLSNFWRIHYEKDQITISGCGC